MANIIGGLKPPEPTPSAVPVKQVSNLILASGQRELVYLLN
jgi:hypothetical protein